MAIGRGTTRRAFADRIGSLQHLGRGGRLAAGFREAGRLVDWLFWRSYVPASSIAHRAGTDFTLLRRLLRQTLTPCSLFSREADLLFQNSGMHVILRW